jgi:alkanesulfonate monooxygenase SsuD/methylene tetrahydromethanopterin reductase-like flavin-dependent oxidoreductase (luciferase family)
MRFAVWPNLQQPWNDVVGIVRHAEATGWDGVYLADHFMGDGGAFGPTGTPTYEATAAIAALLASTERLRIGSLVFGASYRHPALLANWAATVDHASHGRLVLGVGAGWQENEHHQYGFELPPPGDRVRRFDEYCQVLTGLLRDERTTVSGEWYRVGDAICEPKPVQRPLPLLVGAKGDRMLGVAARFADEWNMWASPETITERNAELDRRCEAIDRDPSTIRRSTQALVRLTDDREHAGRFVEAVAPRPAVAGPPGQVAELVGRWDEAGVDEVIVPDFALRRGPAKLDELDRILEAVAPFRTTAG